MPEREWGNLEAAATSLVIRIIDEARMDTKPDVKELAYLIADFCRSEIRAALDKQAMEHALEIQDLQSEHRLDMRLAENEWYERGLHDGDSE